MASINEIVVVNITRETKAVSRAGFGTENIVGHHLRFGERIRFYVDIDGVLVDFDSTDPEAVAASATFAQSSPPERIAISRRATFATNTIALVDVGDIMKIVVDEASSGRNYKVRINATAFTHLATAGQTAAQIATALHTLINAGAEPVTSVDDSAGGLTLTADVPDTPFSLTLETFETDGTTLTNEDLMSVVAAPVVYFAKLNQSWAATTSGSASTAETIELALITAINLLAETITAADAGAGIYTCKPVSVEASFTIDLDDNQTLGTTALADRGTLVSRGTADGTETVATSLAQIEIENSDWYALLLTDNAQATVEAVAAWAEPRVKLYGVSSSQTTITSTSDALDTTSIAAKMKASNFDRSFVAVSDTPENFLEAAWFGDMLPRDPGSATWKFKNLNGQVADDWTSTESTNARDKNANTYETIGGVDITREGTVASGEFIDIIRGIDWLTARIQEAVYATLVNSPKVSYTDAGITIIQNDVAGVLALAVDRGVLAADPAPTTTVPKVADTAQADRTARLLRDVKFTARLAGAIHKVDIDGTLTV